MDIFQYAPWLNNVALLSTIWFLAFIWAFLWKGMALWVSAKQNQKLWFIGMLLINTVGLLEIIYLFYFAKERLTVKKLLTNTKALARGLKLRRKSS